MVQPLQLNTALDIAPLADRYAAQDYAVVDSVLSKPSARRLRDSAQRFDGWTLVTVIEGQHREFVGAEMERLDAARRAPFDALVAREAQAGFCYLYERLNLYEISRRGMVADPVLKAAADLIASKEFLDLGRALTGDADITFADCQLTRYRPGHFLTAHDDSADAMDRSAAFVLNLTEDWCADFGGVLQLLDKGGDVRAGLTPRFNRLALFRVPQSHAVSVVAPYAPGPRFAITGWFRRDAPPEL
jgi:hypothetical protein